MGVKNAQRNEVSYTYLLNLVILCFAEKEERMGGKSKKKDRMYVSAKEYSLSFGGQEFKEKKGHQIHRLPYDCCAISLQPCVDPVAVRVGVKAYLFDIVSLVPFLRKYQRNPVTGEPMTTKEMIRVHFKKNAEGVYLCVIAYVYVRVCVCV